MFVAIVDYQSGNLHSAQKAFERAARESALPYEIMVTGDPDAVLRADRTSFRLGAFGDCYRGLSDTPGMIDALKEAVLKRGRPFFGICVGMQMLADRGLEHGIHQGLGWIGGEVDLIKPSDKSLNIPHMGWNTLSFAKCHALTEGISMGRKGGMHTSCIPTNSCPRMPTMCWRDRMTAVRSRRLSRAAT